MLGDDRERHKYVAISPDWNAEDVLEAIARNDPEELRLVPVAVSMFPNGRIFSQRICLRLASHPNATVRGNAILGFGHLARLFRYLSPDIKPVIEAALHDEADYVRGQANDTADDVEWFLGWILCGREDRRGNPVCRHARHKA